MIGNPSAIHATTFFDHLASMAEAIWFAAHRENRRRDRWEKRRVNHSFYASAGLNGTRAVARRLRQIAAGQLQVTAPA